MTRINTLYGSQTSLVVFASKTATLGPELQVSMVHRPHQWFISFKTAPLAPELQVSMGSKPSSVVLCIRNSNIMTRINSLYGSQTSLVVLCMQNSVTSIRNTSLYGSQPSFVHFACTTSTLGPELQVSMGPRSHLCYFAFKRSRCFACTKRQVRSGTHGD